MDVDVRVETIMEAMPEAIPWFRFILCVLGVWRVTHLLVAEDGPWDLIVRLRKMLGTTMAGQLMDCFYCLSLWISVPFTFFAVSGARAGLLEWLAMWLALSGAACLLHRGDRETLLFENVNNPRLPNDAEGEER